MSLTIKPFWFLALWLLLFLVLSPWCFSLEDGIIINSFGRQIHREHVKHEGWRAASSPCWVRVKGFIVQNTDAGLPPWQLRLTGVLPTHPSLNVRSGKMLFTPAFSIHTAVGNKESPFPYRLVAHSPPPFMHNHVATTSQAGMSVRLTSICTSRPRSVLR